MPHVADFLIQVNRVIVVDAGRITEQKDEKRVRLKKKNQYNLNHNNTGFMNTSLKLPHHM